MLTNINGVNIFHESSGDGPDTLSVDLRDNGRDVTLQGTGNGERESQDRREQPEGHEAQSIRGLPRPSLPCGPGDSTWLSTRSTSAPRTSSVSCFDSPSP